MGVKIQGQVRLTYHKNLPHPLIVVLNVFGLATSKARDMTRRKRRESESAAEARGGARGDVTLFCTPKVKSDKSETDGQICTDGQSLLTDGMQGGLQLPREGMEEKLLHSEFGRACCYCRGCAAGCGSPQHSQTQVHFKVQGVRRVSEFLFIGS